MPWPMDDDRAIELYRQFRHRLRNEGGLALGVAPYPRPFDGQKFHAVAMLWQMAAEGALRELANAINELHRYLQELEAWRPIYAGLSQDEQYDLLLEHVRPLAVLCLNAPYSIRGRIIHATCAVCAHANLFIVWPEGRPKWNGQRADMKTAKRLAARWGRWPHLAQALGAMAGDDFTTATSDFRNQHHHGSPRTIALGSTSMIRPLTGERSGWSFGEWGPLSIEDLLPRLAQEHGLALAAFHGFLALVEEQKDASPPPDHA